MSPRQRKSSRPSGLLIVSPELQGLQITARVCEAYDRLTDCRCVSERTLRAWIHRASNPLPAVRVGTKILVRRSVFDQWLEGHKLETIDVSCIVNDIVSDLVGTN